MDFDFFEFYLLPEVCQWQFFETLSPLTLQRISTVDKYFNYLANRQLKTCLNRITINANVHIKFDKNGDITVINDPTVFNLNFDENGIRNILNKIESCFPCKVLQLQKSDKNDEINNVAEICEKILNYYIFTFKTLTEIRFESINLNSTTLLTTFINAPNLHTVNLSNITFDQSIQFADILSYLPNLRDLSLINVSSIKYDTDSLSLLVKHSKTKSLLKSVKIDPFEEIPNEDDFEALLRSVTKEIEIIWKPNINDLAKFFPKDFIDFCVDPFYTIILHRKTI
uniref:F-box domain-containing protein n=1 Tax=Panagrolaimus superbus TaxID=310955 RepID=A0A914XVN1_9BILA